MVRLTADLVTNAPQFFNPLHERELDLRSELLCAERADICAVLSIAYCGLCTLKDVHRRYVLVALHYGAHKRRTSALAFSTWLWRICAAAATICCSIIH